MQGVFFVGESVGKEGGTGAVIETKPNFPRPDSEALPSRCAFVGDGLWVPAGGRLEAYSLFGTLSIGCRGKGDGSSRGRALVIPRSAGEDNLISACADGAGRVELIMASYSAGAASIGRVAGIFDTRR